MKKIRQIVKEKNVLFISTKNIDYIRNVQEIKLLRENAKQVEVVAFKDKSYLLRIIKVWLVCLFKSIKMYDVIFVGFAPQLMFPFLFFWNRKKEVVIDFFISMYDTFTCDRTYFKPTSFCGRVLHLIDKFTLRNCSHVIVDTIAHGDYFIEEFHETKEKLEVLYLEANTDIYNIDKYVINNVPNVTNVLYFGSVLPLQGVEIILESIKLLNARENINFILIGPIKDIRKQEFTNVEFYSWLSEEELAKKIANADICLAGHFNNQIGKAKRTIAGKTYIYEAMKRKIILGENKANRELFSDDERHFFVKMGDSKALAECIDKVSRM